MKRKNKHANISITENWGLYNQLSLHSSLYEFIEHYHYINLLGKNHLKISYSFQLISSFCS